MILKVHPDKEKAKSLKSTADITLQRLKEIDITKYPTNSLTDYYDIIRKLMEALVSIEGVKIKGEGSHYQIIDYVCKNYKINEGTRIFIQELRDYRNRIAYEGFMIKKDYIISNNDRIIGIIKRLMMLVEGRLSK